VSDTPKTRVADDSTHWLDDRRGLVLLLVVTTIAFARLWGVEFSWDDEALVVDNRVTGSLANFGEFFTRDLWGTTQLEWLKSGYYRPLMLLSLAVDRAIFGLDSTTAHVHSLLWHLGAVAALWAVLRKLASPRGALLGAAFFAVHPLQAEVLALVAARNDSMAAALSLLALWLLLDERVGAARLVGAGLALFAGLLSKESAVLAPIMLLVLDLARWKRPGALSRYVPLALALCAYVVLRINAGVDEGLQATASSLALVGGAALEIAAVYGELIVWPWPLTPARHVNYLAPIWETLMGLAIFMGLVVWGLREAKPRPLAIAGLLWAILAFLPTLAATLDKGLLGERYLYLPLAGLALFGAIAIPRPPKWALPALLIPCVALLQLRLPQWQDSRTVWEHAHEVDPTPFTAAGLAWYYHRDRDLEPAIELLEMAVKGEPPYRDACDLVLMACLEAREVAQATAIGDWERAQRQAGKPVCRADSLFFHHYAVALAGSGRWEEASELALNLPRGPSGPSLVVVGAAYARKGDYQTLGRIAAQDKGEPPFLKRVIKLLELSGDTAAAEQLKGAIEQGRRAAAQQAEQQAAQQGTPADAATQVPDGEDAP